MTVRDILQSIGRRWYVFLLVVVAVAVLTVVFYLDGGTYATKTTVTFSGPEQKSVLASETTTDSGVVAFAGAVAIELNGGKPVQSYASNAAPYYGAGVRQGVSVSLRNVGSQWAVSYPSAMIDVQIVGRSREWVEARQREILDDIFSVAAAQQGSVVTTDEDRISVDVDPLSMNIEHVASNRTTQVLAVASMTLVAVLVGASLCVFADRTRRGVAPHRAEQSRRLSAAVGESYL